MSGFNNSGGLSHAYSQQASQQDDCKDSLLAVIEQQIIPRLLNVHQLFPAKFQALREQESVAEQRPGFYLHQG